MPNKETVLLCPIYAPAIYEIYNYRYTEYDFLAEIVMPQP